jgi:hypothetical protein
MGGKARKKKLAGAFLCCRVKDLVNLLGISRSRLYSYIYIKNRNFQSPQNWTDVVCGWRWSSRFGQAKKLRTGNGSQEGRRVEEVLGQYRNGLIPDKNVEVAQC